MALITTSGQYPFASGTPAGAALALGAVGVTGVVTLPMKLQLYQAAGISMLVNFSSGANATATVQVSNDPTAYTSPTTALWNSHDVLKAITASTNSSVVYPIYAFRLQLTAWVAGTVTLQVGIFDYQL